MKPYHEMNWDERGPFELKRSSRYLCWTEMRVTSTGGRAQGQIKRGTLGHLSQRLRSTRPVGMAVRRSFEPSGLAIVPAIYEETYSGAVREHTPPKGADLVILDTRPFEERTLEEIGAGLNDASIQAHVWTTFHHSVDDPRYRILVPLSRMVSVDEYVDVWKELAGIIGGKLDAGSADIERPAWTARAFGPEGPRGRTKFRESVMNVDAEGHRILNIPYYPGQDYAAP